MKDFVFKLPDEQLQRRDRTQIKKAVAAVFGDRHDGNASRYLFSPEPRHDLGPWLRVRVCVDSVDVDPRMARRLDVPVPPPGVMVRAVAWVALKQRFPISDKPKAIAKLADMCSHFDDALEVQSFEVDEALELACMERGKSAFQRAFGRIRLLGRVKDQAALEALMRNGIGAAKAYGFGLVDIQEIEHE